MAIGMDTERYGRSEADGGGLERQAKCNMNLLEVGPDSGPSGPSPRVFNT